MSTENTTAQPAAPTGPAPGTAEYNSAMVAKARGEAAPAATGVTSAAPAAATTAATAPAKPQRPANVPEKFWNAETGTVNTEALLASYGELERKQSLPVDQTANIAKPGSVQTTAPTQPNTQQQAPGIAETQAAAKPDPAAIRAQADAEYAKDGKLSDSTYANLASVGFDRHTVDAYITGQKAQAQVVLNGLYTAAGGQDDDA